MDANDANRRMFGACVYILMQCVSTVCNVMPADAPRLTQKANLDAAAVRYGV